MILMIEQTNGGNINVSKGLLKKAGKKQ